MGVKTRIVSVLAASAFCVVSAGAWAQQYNTVTGAEPDIAAVFSGGRVSFQTNDNLSNFVVRIAGPSDYYGQVSSARTLPSIRLADFGEVPDGLYSYEITAATTQQVQSVRRATPGANGRTGNAQVAYVGMSSTGTFYVQDGQIVPFDLTATED